MAKKVKIGLVQMRCSEIKKENLEVAVLRIKRLAKKGAQIICLPELFLSKYFCQTEDKRFFDLAEKVPGPATSILGQVAKKEKIVIIASLFERAAKGKFFNTAAVIDADGKFLGKYRKMHIPDDLEHFYGEAYYFEKGDLGFKAFSTKFGRISVMVCWDQWFPEAARAGAAKGAKILFYPTAIGWQIKERPGINDAEYEAWQLIQRSHAVANGAFVVAVNRVGLENKLNFWGTSFVCDPYGRLIAKAPSDAQADLIAECDLSLSDRMRKDWPFLENRIIKVENVSPR